MPVRSGKEAYAKEGGKGSVLARGVGLRGGAVVVPASENCLPDERRGPGVEGKGPAVEG